MIRGNLGSSERRKRLVFGILSFAAACAWAISGDATSLSGGSILFVLFWFGALGLFQAKEKT